jgi:CDP-diacylglycerol--glycerol-3-phosphate 3-phosphatidyltransferase
MERPERIVLIIIGALFNRMAPVLWIAAVISTITVIHRIAYTYQQSTILQAAVTNNSLAKSSSQSATTETSSVSG